MENTMENTMERKIKLLKAMIDKMTECSCKAYIDGKTELSKELSNMQIGITMAYIALTDESIFNQLAEEYELD